MLEKIVSDDSVQVDVETITYSPRDVYEWDGSELSKTNSLLTRLYSEDKFKDTTWFGFFEEYIVPSIKDKIVLGEPVSSIDYSNAGVTVSTVDNKTFEPASNYQADAIIMAVPMAVLQSEYLTFTPALSTKKIDAINSLVVPEGLKAFFEFDERFYPELLSFSEYSDDSTGEEMLFYDAAFGKGSDKNIVGFLGVGSGTADLVGLSDDEIKDLLLAYLDEIYDGAASRSYQNHIVQNWTANQYIRGTYATEFLESRAATMQEIARPIDNTVYFAGSALSDERQSTVPGAAETAYTAVRALLTQ